MTTARRFARNVGASSALIGLVLVLSGFPVLTVAGFHAALAAVIWGAALTASGVATFFSVFITSESE